MKMFYHYKMLHFFRFILFLAFYLVTMLHQWIIIPLFCTGPNPVVDDKPPLVNKPPSDVNVPSVEMNDGKQFNYKIKFKQNICIFLILYNFSWALNLLNN